MERLLENVSRAIILLMIIMALILFGALTSIIGRCDFCNKRKWLSFVRNILNGQGAWACKECQESHCGKGGDSMLVEI